MARAENAHLWLAEPLMSEPSFLGRRMFGCEACYLNAMLVLVLADTEEPWNGMLVPTAREHQAALIAEFPSLSPHPVLPKWLYLPAERDDFENVAQRIVRAISLNHPLIGVQPREKRRKKGTKKRGRKAPGPAKKRSAR